MGGSWCLLCLRRISASLPPCAEGLWHVISTHGKHFIQLNMKNAARVWCVSLSSGGLFCSRHTWSSKQELIGSIHFGAANRSHRLLLLARRVLHPLADCVGSGWGGVRRQRIMDGCWVPAASSPSSTCPAFRVFSPPTLPPTLLEIFHHLHKGSHPANLSCQTWSGTSVGRSSASTSIN